LKALKLSKVVNDDQLGTVTGKNISARTLRKMNMIKKEEYIKLKTDLQESFVVSNLMDDFLPICKQDPNDVKTYFIYDHWEKTGETIKFDDVLEKMYGGALPVARKRKSNKMATLEADDDEEASELKKKKAKKAKDASKEQATSSDIPSIQNEVQEL